MLDYISIGQIIGTHGVKGELKVFPLTDDIRRFDDAEIVYIDEDNVLKKYEIRHRKYIGNLVVIKLLGIDDIDSAKKFRKKYLKVHRSDAVELPQDSFFICDLVGIEVFTEEGLFLGKVTDVFETGSNDVFVVKNMDKEVLIPALKSIFKEVDVYKGKIIVELPEGLI